MKISLSNLINKKKNLQNKKKSNFKNSKNGKMKKEKKFKKKKNPWIEPAKC